MRHSTGNDRSMAHSLTALFLMVAISLITFAPFDGAVLANVLARRISTRVPTSTLQEAQSAVDTNITSVSATQTAGGVLVQWRANFESDNVGFYVYRIQGRR